MPLFNRKHWNCLCKKQCHKRIGKATTKMSLQDCLESKHVFHGNLFGFDPLQLHLPLEVISGERMDAWTWCTVTCSDNNDWPHCLFRTGHTYLCTDEVRGTTTISQKFVNKQLSQFECVCVLVDQKPKGSQMQRYIWLIEDPLHNLPCYTSKGTVPIRVNSRFAD